MTFIEAGVSGGIEFEKHAEGSRLTQIVQLDDLIIFPKLDRAFRNTRNALIIVDDSATYRAWAHWLDNTDKAKVGKSICYEEIVRRTGIEFIPRT